MKKINRFTVGDNHGKSLGTARKREEKRLGFPRERRIECKRRMGIKERRETKTTMRMR
jgi:hypothetical protein